VVGEIDLDLFGALDDMGIGQDNPLGADDEPGTETLLALRHPRLTEQVTEELVKQRPRRGTARTRSARMLTTAGVTLTETSVKARWVASSSAGGSSTGGRASSVRTDFSMVASGRLVATGEQHPGAKRNPAQQREKHPFHDCLHLSTNFAAG